MKMSLKALLACACMALPTLACAQTPAQNTADPNAPHISLSPENPTLIKFSRQEMLDIIKANSPENPTYSQNATADITTYGTGLMENYDSHGHCHSLRRDEQDHLINGYDVHMDKAKTHFVINYHMDKLHTTPLSLSVCGKPATIQEKNRDTTTGTITLDARHPDTKDIQDFNGRHIATFISS